MPGFLRNLNGLAAAAGLLGLMICAPSAAHAQIPCRYEIAATIQSPVCPILNYSMPTFATAISPNGEYVCGYYQQCFNGNSRAFVYRVSTQQFTTLSYPPGGLSTMYAADVSDAGLVVGEYGVPTGYRGYVYNIATGQYTELVPLADGAWCSANAINSSGEVCGARSINSGRETAFKWRNGQYTDLGLIDGNTTRAVDINDFGSVIVNVGSSSDVGGQAYLWKSSELIPFGFVPDGYSSNASAINNREEVTAGGLIKLKPLRTAGFLYTGGEWMQLMTLAGHTVAGGSDISDGGMIVGQSRPDVSGEPAWRACIWHDGAAFDLNALVKTNPSGLEFLAATGINQQGRIVVVLHHPVSPQSALLTPVFSAAGDTNCDGVVNIDDLVKVITTWGPCLACSSDLNGNQIVNIEDLMLVILNWSR